MLDFFKLKLYEEGLATSEILTTVHGGDVAAVAAESGVAPEKLLDFSAV